MDIASMRPLNSIGSASAGANAVTAPGETGAARIAKQFGEFLNDALNGLSEQSAAVDALNEQFVKGEPVDVHNLLIASERAALGLELTVQIRNKAIEAYQEIMRTQI